MKSRSTLVLITGLFALACAGEAAEEGMAADATAEAAATTMTDDEAAIDQFRMDFVEHYNMHHASVVADLYSDSAMVFSADGAMSEGKAEVLAALETAMAGTPTLDLTERGTMVFGDWAVAIGDYGVEMSPEGMTMSTAGHYMTVFNRQDAAWKIQFLVTNYNAPPPEGLPMAEQDEAAEMPPEEGTMTDLVAAYETHFNLGHPDMVADLYTEDATASLSNLPIAEGRDAIAALMAERFAAGSPQLDIHDIGTLDLGEGWAIDGGWYELTATTEEGAVNQSGTYFLLARQQDDGSWKIHWAVSNGQPVPAT